jgi:hypothetical protein
MQLQPKTIETIRCLIEDPFPPTNPVALLGAAADWYMHFADDRIYKLVLLHLLRLLVFDEPFDIMRAELDKKEFEVKLEGLSQPRSPGRDERPASPGKWESAVFSDAASDKAT